jgi:hypothetical protein
MKGSYRYPQKRIDKKDDYLEILVVKYAYPGLNLNATNLVQRTSTEALGENIKKPEYQILLPMPQGISDTNLVKWGQDEINPLEAAGTAGAAEAVKGDPMGGVQKFVGAIQNVATSGNAQNLITNYAAAKAVGAFGGNVTLEGALARTSGQVLNSNMELLFQGVQLRSFNFSFNLAPRFEEEAKEVKKIIRTFKQSMAAKTSGGGAGGGLFISSPEVFQLTYKSGGKKHPFLHSFKPCALVNMGVDYAASNVYATYEDATPVHMKLSLSFQELNPIYFDDYDKIPLTDGVGY